MESESSSTIIDNKSEKLQIESLDYNKTLKIEEVKVQEQVNLSLVDCLLRGESTLFIINLNRG